MFEHRRKRRALLRQLADVDKEREDYFLRLKDVRPEELQLLNIPLFRFNTRKYDLEMELEVLEASRLLDRAKRWGVEGSAPQELYDPNYTGVKPRPYFKPQYKEQMRNMIADARRKRIGEWVNIFSPLATVILSVLALLISVLALYLQFTSQTR